MQTRHMPIVGARYWTGLTLASLFGTNLGDLYAHEIGLGIYAGLAVLAMLAAAAFLAERRDPAPRELWYWLVIIIIRTGATNIADWLAYKLAVPEWPLSLALGALVAAFGWASLRRGDHAERETEARTGMPRTGAVYWAAMLSAGVFGTVVGDVAQMVFGDVQACIGLTVLLLASLALWKAKGGIMPWLYWLAVAIARTAGTALGDFLAESDKVPIGLVAATAITGVTFLFVLLFWPPRSSAPRHPGA